MDNIISGYFLRSEKNNSNIPNIERFYYSWTVYTFNLSIIRI